jgi:hypothetical protein
MFSDYIITHEEAQRQAREVLENMTDYSAYTSHDVVVDREGGVVAVKVRLELENGVTTEFEATGSAKCHPKDEFAARLGMKIATARALRRLANQLEEASEYAFKAAPKVCGVVDSLVGATAQVTVPQRNYGTFTAPISNIKWHWDSEGRDGV